MTREGKYYRVHTPGIDSRALIGANGTQPITLSSDNVGRTTQTTHKHATYRNIWIRVQQSKNPNARGIQQGSGVQRSNSRLLLTRRVSSLDL